MIYTSDTVTDYTLKQYVLCLNKYGRMLFYNMTFHIYSQYTFHQKSYHTQKKNKSNKEYQFKLLKIQ